MFIVKNKKIIRKKGKKLIRILSEEGFHNRFLLFINDQFQKKIVETFSEEGFHNIYASFFPWGEENYHSE